MILSFCSSLCVALDFQRHRAQARQAIKRGEDCNDVSERQDNHGPSLGLGKYAIAGKIARLWTLKGAMIGLVIALMLQRFGRFGEWHTGNRCG